MNFYVKVFMSSSLDDVFYNWNIEMFKPVKAQVLALNLDSPKAAMSYIYDSHTPDDPVMLVSYIDDDFPQLGIGWVVGGWYRNE